MDGTERKTQNAKRRTGFGLCFSIHKLITRDGLFFSLHIYKECSVNSTEMMQEKEGIQNAMQMSICLPHSIKHASSYYSSSDSSSATYFNSLVTLTLSEKRRKQGNAYIIMESLALGCLFNHTNTNAEITKVLALRTFKRVSLQQRLHDG